MFIAVEKNANNISVLDTTDGVVETYSKDTLRGILSSDILVLGVTLDSLLVDSLAKVYIRYNDNDEIMDFNGFTSFVAGEVPEYFYQVVYLGSIKKDIDSRKDVENLITHLQRLNSGIKPKFNYSTAVIGGKIVDSDSIGFYTDTDDYVDIAYILYDLYYENKKYDGLAYNFDNRGLCDSISFNNITYKICDLLTELWSYDSASEGTQYTDHISVTSDDAYQQSSWLSLDKDFGGDKAKIFSNIYFIPIYNARRSVVESDIPIRTVANFVESITGVDANFVYSKDDKMPLDEFYHYAIIFPNQFEEEIKRNHNGYLAKMSFTGKKHLVNPRFNAWELQDAEPLTCFRFGQVDKKYRSCIRTPYGVIEIENRDIVNEYDYLFINQITYTGANWLELGSNQMHFGTATQCAEAGTSIKSFDFFDSCCELGISYHDDDIIPLAVTEVGLDEGSLNLTVLCVVNYDGKGAARGKKVKRSDFGWAEFGLSIFYMPIIFLGSKIIHSNGYYVFELGLQRVYIPNTVMTHIEGSFVSYNVFGDYLNLSHKKERAMYDYLAKHLERKLRP